MTRPSLEKKHNFGFPTPSRLKLMFFFFFSTSTCSFCVSASLYAIKEVLKSQSSQKLYEIFMLQERSDEGERSVFLHSSVLQLNGHVCEVGWLREVCLLVIVDTVI